jgi:hypothetical protein
MKETKDRLFLLCEECESAWRTPEETSSLEKNFSIAGLNFGFAEFEDIVGPDWSRHTMTEAKT